MLSFIRSTVPNYIDYVGHREPFKIEYKFNDATMRSRLHEPVRAV